MHYVYIIYSTEFDIYYKGEITDFIKRLIAHNSGESKFTKDRGSWDLVYLEMCENRQLALKREKSALIEGQ
jgi:putative endonuclease